MIVLVTKLRVGTCFIDVLGNEWKLIGKESLYVWAVRTSDNKKDMFANCAEVTVNEAGN